MSELSRDDKQCNAVPDETAWEMCRHIRIDPGREGICEKCPALVETSYGAGTQMCRMLAEDAYRTAIRLTPSAEPRSDPVAWMSTLQPGGVITDGEKRYWLKEWPKQAKHYTIPLYRAASATATEDSEKPLLRAVRRLCEQIRKGNLADDHGHDFTMNAEFIVAEALVGASPRSPESHSKEKP